MARTFNGNIWNGIGTAVTRDAAMRRQEKRDALGGLLDMAKFLEKANANRNLREDWQKYFEDRKAAGDAADAAMVDNALALEDLADTANTDNIFGIVPEQPADEVAASIWDPSMIANGYNPDIDFMATFDPNTASPEDIIRAQQIIGTTPDGIWGRKSREALKAWRG